MTNDERMSNDGMTKGSHGVSVCLLAMAVVLLGVSLRGKEWLYREWAVVTLLGATVMLVGAMVFAKYFLVGPAAANIVVWVLGVAVGFQFVMLILERPGSGSNVPW